MSILKIDDRPQADDLPDLPLYNRSTQHIAAPNAVYANLMDDPEVIRAWGGERVQCVCIAATAFAILLLLVPIKDIGLPDILRKSDQFGGDKIAHALLFATLTGMYCCVFLPFCRNPVKTFEYITFFRLTLIVGSIVTLAVGTEFAQPHFGRTFEWTDMFIDIVAIIPGFGLFLVFNQIRHKSVTSRNY